MILKPPKENTSEKNGDYNVTLHFVFLMIRLKCSVFIFSHVKTIVTVKVKGIHPSYKVEVGHEWWRLIFLWQLIYEILYRLSVILIVWEKN